MMGTNIEQLRADVTKLAAAWLSAPPEGKRAAWAEIAKWNEGRHPDEQLKMSDFFEAVEAQPFDSARAPRPGQPSLDEVKLTSKLTSRVTTRVTSQLAAKDQEIEQLKSDVAKLAELMTRAVDKAAEPMTMRVVVDPETGLPIALERA